jgi:hypothetical protein
MLAFAEALQKANSSSGKMDEWEAKGFGMTVERFLTIKQAFEDTYSVVTDTFEKGYKMPKYKRSGWKACGNY